MNILERARILIDQLKSGRTVNSQVYGQIYKELLGKKWTYTNCIPCLKQNNLEMERRIMELEKDGGCLGCKKSGCNNVWCSNGSCQECQDKLNKIEPNNDPIDNEVKVEDVILKEEPKKRGPKKKS